MPPTLQEIENKIDEYLFLPDKEIIKLLCAFALTCKLPVLPLWLFIASGSSTGKTELLNLLEMVPGWYMLDDMTENTMLSGMKRHDQSSSLLDRIPKKGFIVFKDFTTMLSKNKDTLGAIMGKLRVIYDGSYTRNTGGQVEEKRWEGKLSLLAAGTGTIYSKTEEFNEMGTRSVVYKMHAAGDYEVGEFKYNHQHNDRVEQKRELQTLVAAYVAGFKVPATYQELPIISRDIWQDLVDIAHLASTARSPVEREKWGNNKRQTMIHEKEGMGRLFGQLQSAAYGLMLQNPEMTLTDLDRKLLYKIGLDCIDPRRRGVLQALTKNAYGGDTHSIGDSMGYVKESADIFVEDLFAHGMLNKQRSGNKTTYTIKDEYRDIISKFENIKSEKKSLTIAEESTPAPEVNWDQVTDYMAS